MWSQGRPRWSAGNGTPEAACLDAWELPALSLRASRRDRGRTATPPPGVDLPGPLPISDRVPRQSSFPARAGRARHVEDEMRIRGDAAIHHREASVGSRRDITLNGTMTAPAV